MDDTQTPLSCTNCQQITTDEGKPVWVCENCGTENINSELTSAPNPNMSPPQASVPVSPANAASDPIAAAAQADISAASAQAGAPLTDVPPIAAQPATPVENPIPVSPTDQTVS